MSAFFFDIYCVILSLRAVNVSFVVESPRDEFMYIAEMTSFIVYAFIVYIEFLSNMQIAYGVVFSPATFPPMYSGQ